MATPLGENIIKNVVDRLNSAERRIRQLEENLRNLRDQLRSMENDLIEVKKESREVRERFDMRSNEIKSALIKMDTEIKEINNRLRKMVSKREIKELESFMEIFSPVKNMYVTRNEVKKMIDEALEKQIERY